MATPPMFRLESYDLQSEADVKRLAEEIGQAWTEAVAPLAARTKEDHLGLFWGHMLAGPFGAMWRSVGPQNAEAVTDLLRRVCRALDEDRSKVTH